MHFVTAKGILSSKNGMNAYRGCTHGCIYCDSRSICYGMNHDFEDIEVKQNAPELLEDALRRKRSRCMIGTGSMCDPYMHCEEQLRITRRCLEAVFNNGFGATIITKSARVLQDLELLKSINAASKCVVQMTLTTFDEKLCRIVEPNVSTTRERCEALKVLHSNGIPTVVWLSPILPFINDTEQNLNGLLDLCFEAGVAGIICFGIGLTLRSGNREYFYSKLDEHFPGMRRKYENTFGNAYSCMSDNDRTLRKLFKSRCRANGVMCDNEDIFEYLSEFPADESQLSLF